MAVRGQFGDIFGGVNALFTGLAFAGVIYTILLQRRELELQRNELRLNREELSRSAQAQTDQVSRMKEAADLSAMTSLLNVYSRTLEPYWANTHDLRTQLGRAESTDPRLRSSEKINYLREQIQRSQYAWTDTLKKHQELTSKLEQMVEQSFRDDSSNAEGPSQP